MGTSQSGYEARKISRDLTAARERITGPKAIFLTLPGEGSTGLDAPCDPVEALTRISDFAARHPTPCMAVRAIQRDFCVPWTAVSSSSRSRSIGIPAPAPPVENSLLVAWRLALVALLAPSRFSPGPARCVGPLAERLTDGIQATRERLPVCAPCVPRAES